MPEDHEHHDGMNECPICDRRNQIITIHPPRRVSTVQEWVSGLSFMQQAVLFSALRGPDGVKNPAEKAIKRWYRRSILYSAFESAAAGVPIRILTPTEDGGGSFTGPLPENFKTMEEATRAYVASLDLFPHHYLMHVLGAAEIVGYKHDEPSVRRWWHEFYLRLVRNMHLRPESVEEMDRRLGDSEAIWRANEK